MTLLTLFKYKKMNNLRISPLYFFLKTQLDFQQRRNIGLTSILKVKKLVDNLLTDCCLPQEAPRFSSSFVRTAYDFLKQMTTKNDIPKLKAVQLFLQNGIKCCLSVFTAGYINTLAVCGAGTTSKIRTLSFFINGVLKNSAVEQAVIGSPQLIALPILIAELNTINTGIATFVLNSHSLVGNVLTYNVTTTLDPTTIGASVNLVVTDVCII